MPRLQLVPQGRLLRVILGLWSGCALGCGQKPPADFRLELTEVIASRDPAKVTVRVFEADGVQSTPDIKGPLTVQPTGLARVDELGFLTCQKSGDGQVSLRLGQNTRSAPVRCRLVERVDASNVGRVDLNDGPFVPKIRILGAGGIDLQGVPLMLSTRNTGVLFPRGSQLVPKAVGSATVVARAGQVSQEFTVDVVRKVTPEALPLMNNTKIFFSLESGKYEFVMDLPSVQRLTAEWREAPYCNYSAVARRHVSICVLRTKGGVVFDNPATLLGNSTEISVQGVSIAEIP